MTVLSRLLVSGVLLAAHGALADTCTPQSTINQCLRAGVEEAETDGQRNALALSNTGAIDGSAGTTTTTLSDFASKVRLGFDSVNFGDNGNQGLSIDWNGFVHDLLIATFFEEDDVWEWAKEAQKP